MSGLSRNAAHKGRSRLTGPLGTHRAHKGRKGRRKCRSRKERKGRKVTAPFLSSLASQLPAGKRKPPRTAGRCCGDFERSGPTPAARTASDSSSASCPWPTDSGFRSGSAPGPAPCWVLRVQQHRLLSGKTKNAARNRPIDRMIPSTG